MTNRSGRKDPVNSNSKKIMNLLNNKSKSEKLEDKYKDRFSRYITKNLVTTNNLIVEDLISRLEEILLEYHAETKVKDAKIKSWNDIKVIIGDSQRMKKNRIEMIFYFYIIGEKDVKDFNRDDDILFLIMKFEPSIIPGNNYETIVKLDYSYWSKRNEVVGSTLNDLNLYLKVSNGRELHYSFKQWREELKFVGKSELTNTIFQ